MNEYNHHRIIDVVASSLHLGQQTIKTLKDASTFADDIKAEFSYFFYHFYYDLRLKDSNTLVLSNVNKHYNYNQSVVSMSHCGEKESSLYVLNNWDPSFDEKEFFSSINGRNKSNHGDFLDIGNQSDNVAFLHAMAAKDENIKKAQEKFEDHLKYCFSAYLFLANEIDALFILGIGLHGIMDSFTPSHTNFQKYTEQDMALHAQGDVIRILDGKDKFEFDPGQFNEEKWYVQFGFKEIIAKGYDSDNYINPIEFEMLRIFLILSNVTFKSTGKELDDEEIDELWKTLHNKTKTEINKILNDNYCSGLKACIFSEASIYVLGEIYKFLSKAREICKEQGYNYYSENKADVISKALNTWKDIYEGEKLLYGKYNVHELILEHTNLNLYSKENEIVNEYRKQMAIDKANQYNCFMY